MSEPTTVAGRALLVAIHGDRPGGAHYHDRIGVAAIEAEAARDALEELRRVVGVLPVIENEWDSTYGPDEPEELVDRAAVLATIAAAMPEEGPAVTLPTIAEVREALAEWMVPADMEHAEPCRALLDRLEGCEIVDRDSLLAIADLLVAWADLMRYGQAHDYRTETWWDAVERGNTAAAILSPRRARP